jgi:hypothetical protein
MENPMADKMLRHIPTGTLYIWQPAFAQRADFEDYVPEPEPVVEAPAVVDAPAPKAKTSRKKAEAAPEPEPVVKYAPEPAFVDEAALSADASRGLP